MLQPVVEEKQPLLRICARGGPDMYRLLNTTFMREKLFEVAHRKPAMIRWRLFTAASVLSLLLCVATLSLWVRSYWGFDVLAHCRADGQISHICGVQYGRGELNVITAMCSVAYGPPRHARAPPRVRD